MLLFRALLGKHDPETFAPDHASKWRSSTLPVFKATYEELHAVAQASSSLAPDILTTMESPL